MLNEIEYLNYKILYKEKEIKERELELINKEKNYEIIKLEKDFETKRNNEILKTEKKIQEINYNKKYDILTLNYKKEELNLKNETEMRKEEKEFNNKFLTLKNKKYTNLSNQLSEEEKRSKKSLEFYKKTNNELQSSILREIDNYIKEYIRDGRSLRELNFEFNKKEEEILKKKAIYKRKKKYNKE